MPRLARAVHLACAGPAPGRRASRTSSASRRAPSCWPTTASAASTNLTRWTSRTRQAGGAEPRHIVRTHISVALPASSRASTVPADKAHVGARGSRAGHVRPSCYPLLLSFLPNRSPTGGHPRGDGAADHLHCQGRHPGEGPRQGASSVTRPVPGPPGPAANEASPIQASPSQTALPGHPECTHLHPGGCQPGGGPIRPVQAAQVQCGAAPGHSVTVRLCSLLLAHAGPHHKACAGLGGVAWAWLVAPSPAPAAGGGSQVLWLGPRSCRFDLLHVMIDEPDAHLDQQIAAHILRWAGCEGGGALPGLGCPAVWLPRQAPRCHPTLLSARLASCLLPQRAPGPGRGPQPAIHHGADAGGARQC